MPTIVGVFREEVFSPGRVADDAAILECTAAALRGRGFAVELGGVERALAPGTSAVLAMCQSPTALASLERSRVVPIVNTPAAIRRCYRRETTRLLSAAGVRFPRTLLVPTTAPAGDAAAPCWVKRGDVHATAPEDVRFAPDPETLRDALATLARRGIAEAALQEHVDGVRVKFYGVADGRFFRCFSDADEPPAALDALWATAAAAAAVLGLEVFGGDCIVPPGAPPVVIDVNDWPSFARCRDEAAEAIAAYVAARLAATATAARVRPGGAAKEAAGA